MLKVNSVTFPGAATKPTHGQSGKSTDKPVEESDKQAQTAQVSDGDKEPTGEDPRNCNFFGCA